MTRRFTLCALVALCLSVLSASPISAAEDVEVEIYGTSFSYSDGEVVATAQFFKIRIGTPSFDIVTSEKVILTACVGKHFAYGRQWIQDDENIWRLIEYHAEVGKITIGSPQACLSVKPEISLKTSADLPPLLRALDSVSLKKVHYFIEFDSGAFFIYLFDEGSPEIANSLAEVFKASSVQ